jgi:hypothetical protein
MAKIVDLKRVNGTAFSFKFAFKANEALRGELEKLLGKLEVGKAGVLGMARRKGDQKWVDIAILEYTEAVEPHFHLTFAYGLDDVPNPPRGVPKPHRLLEILSKSEELVTFACEASFLYKEGAARSIIQLPIPIFRTDSAGFNEIKGVVLSRTQPAGHEYDIRISINPDESVSHDVGFKYESRVTTRIGNELLKKAVDISQQFLK